MATIKRLTYDDLEAISQERPGDRHELIDQQWVHLIGAKTIDAPPDLMVEILSPGLALALEAVFMGVTAS